ncbi:MAG: HU family DNA-binding protein [Bacteroides xylanisolvens]
MRKEELIKQVAESTGIAICEVRTVIEAALKETVDAVANGKTLYIRGFGTLSPKHYKRKVARNIHKNETIVIAEHYIPLTCQHLKTELKICRTAWETKRCK